VQLDALAGHELPGRSTGLALHEGQAGLDQALELRARRPRFPVAEEVVQADAPIRLLGDPAPDFQNFDSVVDPKVSGK
jgi:hypothetical protein